MSDIKRLFSDIIAGPVRHCGSTCMSQLGRAVVIYVVGHLSLVCPVWVCRYIAVVDI